MDHNITESRVSLKYDNMNNLPMYGCDAVTDGVDGDTESMIR